MEVFKNWIVVMAAQVCKFTKITELHPYSERIL